MANNLWTAIFKHLKNRFSQNTIKRDIKNANDENNKSIFLNIKEAKTKLQEKVIKKDKSEQTNNFEIIKKMEQVKIKNGRYWFVAIGCVLFGIITLGVSIDAIQKLPSIDNQYNYQKFKYSAEEFSAILGPDTLRITRNGFLNDGKTDFVSTKNVGATNDFLNDVYSVRNKQEQYDSLKSDTSNLLAKIIKANSKYLFSKYPTDEIDLAIDYIKEYLYNETLYLYNISNASSIRNFFQSLGFDGVDDYINRRLEPSAYLYLYFITRLASTSENDPLYSSFNAKKILDLNSFYKTWGLKIAKNYARFENSSNPYCNDLDSITATNGPTFNQWNRVINCVYLNGDVSLGQKQVEADASGNRYFGYLGIFTSTTGDWQKFCDFVSAQRCDDANYGAGNALLDKIYAIFDHLVYSNPSNGFLSGNLVSLDIDEDALDSDTILFPYENYYMIFKIEKMTTFNSFNSDGTLVLSNKNIIDTLSSFLRNSFGADRYKSFCFDTLEKDFSFQGASDKIDVEVSVYDQYSSSLFKSVCNEGIIS